MSGEREEEEFVGLPDVEVYLKNRQYKSPIDPNLLETITDKIAASTLLNKEQAKEVVSHFFEEVRSSLLFGHVVHLQKLGKFLISSPALSGNKRRVFIKFKPMKSLTRKLNEKTI
jgi:hypothetical protein